MRIELAGIPVEAVCRCPENEAFLQGWQTEREPVFTVAPGEEELRLAQDIHNRAEQAAGREPRPLRPAYLENLALHRMLADELALRGVLLMHGSALCMDGEAYIFTARSGTGKSTHARLWREIFGDRVWMINDDKPMLRFTEDGVEVCGTPWMGKHRLGRNASAPLKAVVSLQRGAVNSIRPMTREEACTAVFLQTYASRKPESMQALVNLKLALMERVPCYRLTCNMDPEAARVAWEGMNPQHQPPQP